MKGDDPVVRHNQIIARRHGLAVAIDGDDLATPVKGHAVAFVPGLVVDQDILVDRLARQHRREHDPVVVDPRFGPENRDVVTSGHPGEEFLHGPAGRHAVADHDEALARHAGLATAMLPLREAFRRATASS